MNIITGTIDVTTWILFLTTSFVGWLDMIVCEEDSKKISAL